MSEQATSLFQTGGGVEQRERCVADLQIHPIRRVEIRTARQPLRGKSHPAYNIAVNHVSASYSNGLPSQLNISRDPHTYASPISMTP